ncbi:NAD-dependent epimerase/dehydratase family protein [Microbacterium sp. LRZ72]|uniref:polysaccharide biosynthesis C-terminal domain-containing protein n=1 Tax=Microbacterium sp. LRZ72 TaxID=2942481 RepID=UPI0029BAE73F|nr:NAD-dependent epimerase/dehydratase family protein [Microbacterium sp. LRZ72]MDX2377634.1 NAD-dependent epimerase/dehydratase family protein [Microbacterium sp. LRZ72]
MSGLTLTGAGGFLGWHTRVAARANDVDTVSLKVGSSFSAPRAAETVSGTERLVHVAGVNRGSDAEVHDGNILFATQVADAIRRADEPPQTIVFANSMQASNSSTYGMAKAAAAEILSRVAEDVDIEFVDVLLPNLFGEHGRPFYNSVTATFCHLLARGEYPAVDHDRELTLLHAQNAADLLLGSVSLESQASLEHVETVSGLLGRLTEQANLYRRGEVPTVASPFERDLFNTYRAFAFEGHMPFGLARHADERGSFFELIRSHGGTAQSSISTTAPGVTRGDHFHRRKVERFTVVSGSASISLRRLFTDEVVTFQVSGEEPSAVDMPTMWAHNIRNVGAELLYTSFWTNDLFDPVDPDTISEVV